jgi:hypothetical protein
MCKVTKTTVQLYKLRLVELVVCDNLVTHCVKYDEALVVCKVSRPVSSVNLVFMSQNCKVVQILFGEM